MADSLIDTEASLRRMLNKISNLKPDGTEESHPFLFIDLEGVRLGRNGTVAIMQILAPPSATVYLVDVYCLKDRAFNVTGFNGTSLKDILESKEYVKVFFDVRADSDALFGQFGIDLRTVIDLQLMEFATRGGAVKYVSGLTKCIQFDAELGSRQFQEWRMIKETGRRLFAPGCGGKYEVFLERPLSLSLINYCKQDVLFMPKLLLKYGSKMSSKPNTGLQVLRETRKRVLLSQTPDFRNGKHLAIGPHISQHRSVVTTLPYPLDIMCSDRLADFCTFRVEEETISSQANVEQNLVQVMSTLGFFHGSR